VNEDHTLQVLGLAGNTLVHEDIVGTRGRITEERFLVGIQSHTRPACPSREKADNFRSAPKWAKPHASSGSAGITIAKYVAMMR
jgi:hypothetical protein